jgi:Spy/CpxP family protein refolding chaperone
MRTRVLLLIVTAVMLATASLSFAQPGPAGSPAEEALGPGGDEPTEAQWEEVRKKVEVVKIWKLTEALKLDADTSAKLSAFINPVDHQRQEIVREKMITMRELRLLLQSSKPDEAKLKAAIEKLEKNRRAMHEVRNKEFSGLKDILTTEQQARYLVFQQEFRREMRGMISGARGGGPGKGGMGMGPGGGQGRRGGPMQGGRVQQP